MLFRFYLFLIIRQIEVVEYVPDSSISIGQFHNLFITIGQKLKPYLGLTSWLLNGWHIQHVFLGRKVLKSPSRSFLQKINKNSAMSIKLNWNGWESLSLILVDGYSFCNSFELLKCGNQDFKNALYIKTILPTIISPIFPAQQECL